MFINTPNNFASMWGELNFEYSCTDDTDIVIEIINDVSGDVIAVKKFYSSSSAKINVTPILFNLMLPQPVRAASTSMLLPSSGFPRIRAEVDAEQCSGIYFTYATTDIEAPAMLTTLPTDRLLYSDECDQIAIVAPAATTVTYSLYGMAKGSSSEVIISSSFSSSNGGARNLYLNADEYCQIYDSLRVEFYVDDAVIGSVSYTLSSELSSGYRLAWISSRGSIEHYTFPFVCDETHQSDGATAKTLRSAYGTAAEVEALSEIISSQKVWRVVGDDYQEVSVLTTEQVIRQDGVLSIANIKILENG